ncbi:uncharacterized protein FOMMEDRAFT_164298 [Fomitiporia mediterranea MF3/22]|uniref:uncharacterized protein n=1 Tax=Fomitiporia mediterranea (strain MF3/22) TaxID=694068 RepID=UPI00044088E9|nr:uncharacterized protein FOMMEDRAFT_164298 [Fomitiporia mediterranea MF3/22]EJD07284.1 hypothetical protein FOMMEDRAFT_164298 [Fomitiporia mediterranea MF3/22]
MVATSGAVVLSQDNEEETERPTSLQPLGSGFGLPDEKPHIVPDSGHALHKSIIEDLQARVIDWKGHSLSSLGPLQMFDVLLVRRDALVREFCFYLLEEAIICVGEEKKCPPGSIVSEKLGKCDTFDVRGNTLGKSALELKGRIFIWHIKQVTDTSAPGELRLRIDLKDSRLESFVLIFKDRSNLEVWKADIERLIELHSRRRNSFGFLPGFSLFTRFLPPSLHASDRARY